MRRGACIRGAIMSHDIANLSTVEWIPAFCRFCLLPSERLSLHEACNGLQGAQRSKDPDKVFVVIVAFKLANKIAARTSKKVV